MLIDSRWEECKSEVIATALLQVNSAHPSITNVYINTQDLYKANEFNYIQTQLITRKLAKRLQSEGFKVRLGSVQT